MDMKKDNHYVAWGVTAVAVACAILLFYDIVFRDSVLLEYIGLLVDILAPVLYGFALAYLLSPLVNWFERIIFRYDKKSHRGAPTIRGKSVRVFSMLLTWLVVLAVVYGLLRVLLPELYQSILQLAGNAERYYYTVVEWVERLLENNPQIAQKVYDLFNEYYQDALAWLQEKLVPQLQVAIQAVSGGVVGAVVLFKNLLVGVIVSLYLLWGKEGFAAGGKRLTYALLPEDWAKLLIKGTRATDKIFSGFVRGKLVDSLIIGILCFIGCNILDLPYAPVVSVVVGVTNIIPYFGPFLGAIPSAFLILLDSPSKCLTFIIFIIVLQQFDGNILGPKILGGTTGLSGFWVILGITLGGGLWGVPGMFFGVPILACVRGAIQYYQNYRLEKKGLSTDLADYAAGGPMDDAPKPPEPKPEEEQQTP
jgi:predicted PurR-regulated permease PerM